MKRVGGLYISLAIVMFFTNSFLYPHETGTIKVKITGLRSNKGEVAIALYSNEAGFPKDISKSVSRLRVKITNNTCTASFAGMPYGNYAVCAFHDENNDGKLNFNFLGIPKEGTCASNNAKGHFGPPSFDDAKFLLNAVSITINIKMNY